MATPSGRTDAPVDHATPAAPDAEAAVGTARNDGPVRHCRSRMIVVAGVVVAAVG